MEQNPWGMMKSFVPQSWQNASARFFTPPTIDPRTAPLPGPPIPGAEFRAPIPIGFDMKAMPMPVPPAMPGPPGVQPTATGDEYRAAGDAMYKRIQEVLYGNKK